MAMSEDMYVALLYAGAALLALAGVGVIVYVLDQWFGSGGSV
jgi:hypothetical protein